VVTPSRLEAVAGLGVVVHKSEDTTLRHHVVVNPPALFIKPAARHVLTSTCLPFSRLTLAGKVIGEGGRRIACDHRKHFVAEHEQARRLQPHLWTKLRNKGILSRKLLPLLWSDLPDASHLERLMVKFGLIVPLLPAWSALMDAPDSGLVGGASAGGRSAAEEGEGVREERQRASAEEEYVVPSIFPELQEGDLLRGCEVRLAHSASVAQGSAVRR
jgi:hypothetical protein